MDSYTAEQIAGDPELFNGVYLHGGQEWECIGYSRSGLTVHFARLIPLPGLKVRQVNIYLDPGTRLHQVERGNPTR